MREESRCRHMGYSFRLAAMVLLYAPSHRQDSTYHGLCYTSRGALAPRWGDRFGRQENEAANSDPTRHLPTDTPTDTSWQNIPTDTSWQNIPTDNSQQNLLTDTSRQNLPTRWTYYMWCVLVADHHSWFQLSD